MPGGLPGGRLVTLAIATLALPGAACRPAPPHARAGTVAVMPFLIRPSVGAWMAGPLAEETERALVQAGAAVWTSGAAQAADFELSGTLTGTGLLDANVRLLRLADSAVVIERTFSLDRGTLAELPGRAAALVAVTFGLTSDTSVSTGNTRAYLTYLRALTYRGSADTVDVRWAAELFRQVIAADSEYAPAWRGLADVLGQLATRSAHPQQNLLDEWHEAQRYELALSRRAP